MKRLDLPGGGQSPHFIGSWQIEPVSLCQDIIDYFESRPDRQEDGKTGGGRNADIKKSTDIVLHPNDIAGSGNEPIRTYVDCLYDCYRDYVEQWPFLETFTPRVEMGSFNIQRYHPGDHFQKIHTERGSLSTLHRVFAWMTYLNDVEDGGSTFFSHYDLDVKPEAGKTLIWPAEWTHAHAGRVLNSGVKYIVTGWLNFPVDT